MATKKVYWNTIAQLWAKFSTAFISIFLIKILTGYLSIDNYWLYSKIYNYMSVFAALADLGLFTITIREISNHREDSQKVQKIIGNMMTVRLSLGIFVVVLWLAIAFFLPWYNSSLALASIFIAWFFTFFGLMNSAILSLLQAYLKTEYSFISTTTGKLVNFLFVLLVVFIIYPKSVIVWNPDLVFKSFLWIMWAWVIGNALMTAMIYNYARKIEKISFKFDTDIIKKLVMMSIPYWMALFLNIVYFKIDVILISILESWDIADTHIALYSVPMKIVEVWMMFGWLFLQSMLPLFSENIFKKKFNELWVLLEKSYRILFIFWVWIVAYSMVWWYEVLRLVATPDYLDHTKYLYNSLDAYRVTVFIFLFYFISSIFTYLLIANNEQSKLLRINFFITILNVVGNFILIPQYSFIWSAVSTLISQIVLLFFTYRASRHIYRFNFAPFFSITVWIFAILWSIISFIVRNYLYSLWFNFITVLIISVSIFALIYFSWIVLIFYRSKLSKLIIRN